MEFLKLKSGRDVAEVLRGGIFEPNLQAEILQKSQEVEGIKQKYRERYCIFFMR